MQSQPKAARIAVLAAIVVLSAVFVAGRPSLGADQREAHRRAEAGLAGRAAPMGPAVSETSRSTAGPVGDPTSLPAPRGRGSGIAGQAAVPARELGTGPITVIDACLDGVGDCPPAATTTTTLPPFHEDPLDEPADDQGEPGGPPRCGAATDSGGGATYQVTGADPFSARTGPGRHFPPARKLSTGDAVDVVCWLDGEVAVGSARWDRAAWRDVGT